MTEIPEHLLKRSQARRAALAGQPAPTEESASEEAPASEVDKPAGAAPPAGRPPATPAAPTPPPAPKPDPPYVAAAKSRKKIPYWAVPVLAILPVWGLIYYNSVQKPPAGANDPLVLGQQVFAQNCASCHGTTGGGGTGAVLANGEVLKTFPKPLAMVHWISFGAEGGARPDGTYGDPKRPGGVHRTSTLPAVMPAWKDSLSTEQIAAVTMYVRETLSGAKPTDPTEKGFTPTDFDTLPDKITQVIQLGPGGDPKLSSIK